MTAPNPDRTYTSAVLAPLNPVDQFWAMNWVRFFLRDTPDDQLNFLQDGLTDLEIFAALELDALRDITTGTVYYRPHVTATRLYLGDPTVWRTRSVEGGSETRRDPNDVVASWVLMGQAMDALIPVALFPVESQLSPTSKPRTTSIPIRRVGL